MPPTRPSFRASWPAPGPWFLRSLTKFYAMPGLRVGYAFADGLTAGRMRALQEGWPVGQLDLLAAEAALRDRDFEARSLEVFRSDAPLFQERLRELGLKPLPSAGPYVLAKLPDGLTGTGLAAALRPKGILVRTCTSWAGLGDGYVRLALKSRADQDGLMRALKNIIQPVPTGMERADSTASLIQ